MTPKFPSFFRPKLFDLFTGKEPYSRQLFTSDLIAGMVVGVVALPLAIAFGIASGVTPQQGIITAIVAGFLISFFGGSNFLIGGPTGAFIVIVYGIVQQYGMNGLIIATVLAGVMLIIMGVAKLGTIIKYIPYPIIVGFTGGIAVIIFSTQVGDFLGLDIVNQPADFFPKWGAIFGHIGNIDIWTTLLSLLTVAIIIIWPRFSKKLPGSLVALVAVTGISLLLAHFAAIEVATIGTKFPQLAGGVPLPKAETPHIDMEAIRRLFQPAFTIALLCAIESLLAAMVADGVTGKKHNSNTELIGQGIANIITPLFGGIPATGAIARTMTNINNGGKSPVSGLIHAAVLLLMFLFLMPYAVYIPLSCLAGILVVVAYKMSEWRAFRYLLKGDKADVAVLLVTFGLTVAIDLTIAIQLGLVLAVITFLKRVSDTSSIKAVERELFANENEEAIDPDVLQIPPGVEVYEINGPFFFGLANKFDDVEHNIPHKKIKIRVIRMRKVPFIDSTGLNNLRNLWKRSKAHRIQIVLSGVNEQVRASLERSGFADELGREFICPHISVAMEKVQRMLEN
ncbi:MAG: sulfate permease [Bacteroidales bacterium]|nr:sulfate permease [Bacteroidales bacterium]